MDSFTESPIAYHFPDLVKIRERVIKNQHYELAADFRNLTRALEGHFGNYQSVMDTNRVLAQRLSEAIDQTQQTLPDLLTRLLALRKEATFGNWQGMWGEPGDHDETPGGPIGIMSTFPTYEANGPGPDDYELVGDSAVVGIMAWDENSNELPACDANIDYICALHNSLPKLAELVTTTLRDLELAQRQLKATAVRLPAPVPVATTETNLQPCPYSNHH